MDIATVLYGVLTAGATLLGSEAAKEFAKGAGKTAFDALKSLLTTKHEVKSLALLEGAKDNPAFAAAITSELAKPAIIEDAEVLEQTEILRAAIAAVPRETLAAYAVDVEEIDAAEGVIFRTNEGVKVKSLKTGGTAVFEGNKSPRGN